MRPGILPLDKPPGPSSHEVTAWVRKILGVSKAGHSGTLDPFASGLLLIGIGPATRFLRFLPKEKTYVGIAVGARTSCLRFPSEILQVPPEPAAVRRRPRLKKVHFFRVLEQEGSRVLFSTRVEAGTYVRELVQRCGGRLRELRRTAIGSIPVERAYRLEELEQLGEEAVRPIEEFLTWPRLIAKPSALPNLLRGAPLFPPGVLRDPGGSQVGVLVSGHLVGIYQRFSKGFRPLAVFPWNFPSKGRSSATVFPAE